MSGGEQQLLEVAMAGLAAAEDLAR